MPRWPRTVRFFGPAHIDDDELVAFLDGETGGRRAQKIRSHIKSCWSCRARRQKIESAISQFVEANASLTGSATPPRGWREFETRLDHAEREYANSPRKLASGPLHWSWRIVLGGAAALACLTAARFVIVPAWKTAPEPRKVASLDVQPPVAKPSRPLEQPKDSIYPLVAGSHEKAVKPSQTELLEKAIEIEYALHRVHACLGGEVRIDTGKDALRIEGEIASPEREQEVVAAISGVSMPGWVKRELRPLLSAPSGRRNAQTRSTAVLRAEDPGDAAPPPAEESLRAYLNSHPGAGGMAPGADVAVTAAQFGNRVMAESASAMREAWALRRLSENYGSAELASQPRWLLETMLREHTQKLAALIASITEMIGPMVSGVGQIPPSATGNSWTESIDALFEETGQFELTASALFAASGRKAEARPQPTAMLSTLALQGAAILRDSEIAQHRVAAAFAGSRTRARQDDMRH